MDCRETCNRNCTCLEVVISIVLAAVVGVLYAFNILTGVQTAIWILFGLAVLCLILLAAGLFTASIFRRSPLARCLYCRGNIFLAGIIGTILMTLAALSVTLTLSIWIIVLISIGAFFAALMVIELVLLLACIVEGLRPWREG